MYLSFQVLLSIILLFSLGRESTNATALPARFLSSFRRDVKNATLLELVDQYERFKLQAVATKNYTLKQKLLEQVKIKKLAIEEQLDAPDNTALVTGGATQEPVTVITGTGSKIVLAFMRTTRTVEMSSPITPSPSLTHSSTTNGTAEPVTVLTGTGSRIVLASMGTTRTVDASGASATVTVTVTPGPSNTSMATPTPVLENTPGQ